MKQLKIVFIIILIAIFSSGCYTVVHYNVAGDVIENPPPPPPRPNPPHYPPQPIIIIPAPVNPPPQDYKTRNPENGNDRRRDDVIDPIRNGGGRGNDGGRG